MPNNGLFINTATFR